MTNKIDSLKQRMNKILEEIQSLRTDLDQILKNEEPEIVAGSLWEAEWNESIYLLVQYGDVWLTFNVETGELYSRDSTPEGATEDLSYIDNTYEVVINND